MTSLGSLSPNPVSSHYSRRKTYRLGACSSPVSSNWKLCRPSSNPNLYLQRRGQSLFKQVYATFPALPPGRPNHTYPEPRHSQRGRCREAAMSRRLNTFENGARSSGRFRPVPSATAATRLPRQPPAPSLPFPSLPAPSLPFPARPFPSLHAQQPSRGAWNVSCFPCARSHWGRRWEKGALQTPQGSGRTLTRGTGPCRQRGSGSQRDRWRGTFNMGKHIVFPHRKRLSKDLKRSEEKSSPSNNSIEKKKNIFISH
ncbi:uncharacterized protein LOC127472307 [Manacus candei]|uniref:uncharacterized protein LOC127472307 n=1 Tax=Manacus candei TaxID=415023 RepID=UPI0022267930|nr:uncharacterized protein LOC127472307 [Manacus candei]